VTLPFAHETWFDHGAYPTDWSFAVQFLADHPELNVAQQLGLGINDLPAAGIPFNATLWFFGANELMGHLPIYGAMLAILVYGSDPRLRPAVSALRRP
jgi:hypothetical protein